MMINRKNPSPDLKISWKLVIHIPDNSLIEWLKIAEETFSDWDNEEDSIYDNV